MSNTPTSQVPIALDTFRAADRKIPGVGGIVERCRCRRRPVQKIGARIVRVLVGVEDVATLNFPTGRQAGRRPGFRQLVDRRIDLLRFAAEIDGVCRMNAPLQRA